MLHNRKEKVESFVRAKKHLLHKCEGLIAYYLYNNVCRAKKYTLMDVLGNYFEAFALNHS